MYHRYFGLQEAPFSISVNPRYLFMSARHRDALAHLLYGVDVGGGFVLLTGEVGTGKTTVIRCLLDKLPDNIDVAFVLNPTLKAAELLATVCDEFGIDNPEGEKSLKLLTDKLHQFLLNNHAKDRNTVLLIDEAQHLSFDVLEQIRLLTNLETSTKKLLQIILVGQPELRTLLSKPEFRQLAQRITARYQLKPLTLQETDAYIRHRLHVASLPANQELFPPEVIIRLFKISRGVPRLINILCDRMLLGTYAQNKTVVNLAILNQAAEEVLGEDDDIGINIQNDSLLSVINPFRRTRQPSKSHFQNSKPNYMLIAIIAVIAISVLLWWQWPKQPAPIAAAPKHESKSNHLVDKDDLWSTDKEQALNELLTIQTLSDVAPIDLCENSGVKPSPSKTLTLNLICEQQTVDTWQELKEYNRISVLTLITSSKQKKYATLVAIDNGQAILSYDQGKQTAVSLLKLGKIWTGEFMFVWQAAPYFTNPIGLNDRGQMIKWLASQFATIDGKKTPLTDNIFNTALAQRVKLFQEEHSLKADGLVGLKTLLKINEVLGISKTLMTTAVYEDSTDLPSINDKKSIKDISSTREG